MRFVIFAALLIILSLPVSVGAQSFGGSMDTAPFTLSVIPQYPEPYNDVAISPLSNSLDLANSIMTVSVGGKVIYKGAAQPVAVKTGKAGSVTTVKVTISSGGVSSSETLYIQPQDVVLIAEPVSSAPPLYAGKSLVPLEGSVRVVAVANFRDARGGILKPSTLSYAWTVDNTQIANASGIGKSSLLVASPLQYRARSVSVTVTSQNGSLVGGASVSLTSQEPLVRIYRNDPLLGIRFDHALSGEYAIAGAETTLYGAPFYFPTTTGTPLLDWNLNGARAQTGNSITLRPSGSGEGNASLTLSASSGTSASATADLTLLFGKSASSLFGL